VGGLRLMAVAVLACAACASPDSESGADGRLRDELGLTEADRIHTVSLSTGVRERADPDSILVTPGELVQFVSTDWLVHEVLFELDSLGSEARAFMERRGQSASPPLLQRDSRFVLSFAEAPPGRYPFVLEGNRASGRGVIVVAPPPGFP